MITGVLSLSFRGGRTYRLSSFRGRRGSAAAEPGIGLEVETDSGFDPFGVAPE
jgi:hypothetical protein